MPHCSRRGSTTRSSGPTLLGRAVRLPPDSTPPLPTASLLPDSAPGTRTAVVDSALMSRFSRIAACLFGCLSLFLPHTIDGSEPAASDASAFAAMRWRMIGPFRAGRVSAGALDPSDPNTYYFGTPGGGVWKSTNAGQTWTPVFDSTGMASIGALAIAPSNPRVIYAGTGEETRGDGVYRSADGGATWTNVGLRETQFIGSIVVSADDPDTVVVGAIGGRMPGPD